MSQIPFGAIRGNPSDTTSCVTIVWLSEFFQRDYVVEPAVPTADSTTPPPA